MKAFGYFLGFLVVLMFPGLVFTASVQDSKILRLIPQDAMAVIMLKNKKDDAGLNAIKNALKDKFSIEKTVERQKIIDEMSSMFNVNEVVAAAFYTEKEKPLFILLISGDENGNLISEYSSKINTLFNNPEAVWFEEYSGARVIYNPERFGDPENKDFSCYTILENDLILSNDFELLKKIIDNHLAKGPSLVQSAVFLQAPQVTDQEADGLIFISNTDRGLSKSIESWKKEIGFVPLISADLIQSLWFSFDIVDKNQARGMVVFVPISNDSNDKIISDANFLVEAMSRKFMAENMTYEKSVEVVDNNLVLKFELSGIDELWKRVISEDFDQGQAIQSSPRVSVSSGGAGSNSPLGLILLLAVVVGVISLIGFLRRKQK